MSANKSAKLLVVFPVENTIRTVVQPQDVTQDIGVQLVHKEFQFPDVPQPKEVE